MRKNITKILLIALAIFNVFAFMKVNAQTIQDELFIDYDYQWWVATYNWGTTDRVKTQEKMIRRKSDNAPVYCIQADIKLISGVVNGIVDEDTMVSMTNLSKEQMDRIRLIAYYGYGYGSHTSPEWYYATQMLIWQITNPGYIYAIEDNDSTLTPSNRYDSYYAEINSLVDNHTTQPSFYGQKVEMTAGNTITLTDTNGVLSKYYEGVETDNYSANIDGNNLVITAKTGYEGEIMLTTKENTNRPILYEGANQYCLSAGDPVAGLAYLEIYANVPFTGTKYYGNENTGVYIPEQGAVFELYDESTGELIETLTTDADGAMNINLGFGKYRLHQIKGIESYKFIEDYTFEVTATQTKINVMFKNEKIKSDLVFTKTDFSTDIGLPNTLIEIYDANTDELVFSGRTDEDGYIIIKNMEYGDYYILEKEAPEGYELNPDRMYFSITEDGQIIKVNMKDSRIVEVPDTSSIDYHIFEIIGCIAIISGVGMYVYVKKKKK